jgi:hypothetical protein
VLQGRLQKLAAGAARQLLLCCCSALLVREGLQCRPHIQQAHDVTQLQRHTWQSQHINYQPSSKVVSSADQDTDLSRTARCAFPGPIADSSARKRAQVWMILMSGFNHCQGLDMDAQSQCLPAAQQPTTPAQGAGAPRCLFDPLAGMQRWLGVNRSRAQHHSKWVHRTSDRAQRPSSHLRIQL